MYFKIKHLIYIGKWYKEIALKSTGADKGENLCDLQSLLPDIFEADNYI